MSPDDRRSLAIEVMDDFAERTGISSVAPPTRYLWTDAFAVCNYLGLYEETGEDRFLDLARALVDQVHRILGRHRRDDPRRGWISGLTEDDGERHPTAGGLRIGKPKNERGPDDPYQPLQEWDRDGQYYHYLTKWMYALNRVWRVTGEVHYHHWAVELARVAHAGFLLSYPDGPRLGWKMSIDLSRPLVPSAGHHDPIDGLLATSALIATRSGDLPQDALEAEARQLAEMCRDGSWATDDPLGAGGLLVAAVRTVQLEGLGNAVPVEVSDALLRDSLGSMQKLSGFSFLRLTPERRLAFRELGLALGLEAMSRVDELGAPSGTAVFAERDLQPVRRFVPVGRTIVDFWSHERNRRAHSWVEHRDICDVMWATCLAPEGFLRL